MSPCLHEHRKDFKVEEFNGIKAKDVMSIEPHDGSRKQIVEIVSQITHLYAWSWTARMDDDGKWGDLMFFDKDNTVIFDELPNGLETEEEIEKAIAEKACFTVHRGEAFIVGEEDDCYIIMTTDYTDEVQRHRKMLGIKGLAIGVNKEGDVEQIDKLNGINLLDALAKIFGDKNVPDDCWECKDRITGCEQFDQWRKDHPEEYEQYFNEIEKEVYGE